MRTSREWSDIDELVERSVGPESYVVQFRDGDCCAGVGPATLVVHLRRHILREPDGVLIHHLLHEEREDVCVRSDIRIRRNFERHHRNAHVGSVTSLTLVELFRPLVDIETVPAAASTTTTAGVYAESVEVDW